MTIPAPAALELVKLAGDDDPDLVVLSGFTLTVLPGAAGAGFRTPITYQLDAAGTALATADVNGDGRLDVGVTYAWLEPWASTPALFTGTADGGLAPAGRRERPVPLARDAGPLRDGAAARSERREHGVR